MSGPGPGTEWEANGRTERVRAGGHQETDYVSCTSTSRTEGFIHTLPQLQDFGRDPGQGGEAG